MWGTNYDIENWEQTYKRFETEILGKEKESLAEIEKIKNKYPNHNYVLTTSMGKDSKLVDYLLAKSSIKGKYEKIFNNTTIDCADVYKEVKQYKDIKIVTHTNKDGEYLSFYSMIPKFGTPSRHSRWCCNKFKEGGTMQYFKGKSNILFFMGMRNGESTQRSDYGYEIFNPNWTNKTWVGSLPIRKWGELELWLYTLHFNLSINDKYKKGYQRCGCNVACPYYSESTWVLDKYWFNKGFERWHKLLNEDFIKDEKWYRLNCTQKEYHSCWNGGLLRETPTEEVIQEFMKFKGIADKNIALKYFNKTCCKCKTKDGDPKPIYHKDVIAMNMKMFGRNIEKFMCKKCLMKELNIDKEKWDELVADFKAQGCKLF